MATTARMLQRTSALLKLRSQHPARHFTVAAQSITHPPHTTQQIQALARSLLHQQRMQADGTPPPPTEAPAATSTTNTGLLRGADPVTTSTTDSTDPTPDTIDLSMKPSEMVKQLDRYIIGQADAKRAVAVACRQRWRRHKLRESMRADVTPKNILMIGPTGCGKTEIARRLAKLTNAPFLKVEATKYTEVGFHGKDVDSIVSDLLRVSLQLEKQKYKQRSQQKVSVSVENKLLDALISKDTDARTRESFRTVLRSGALDSMEISVDIPSKDGNGDNTANTVLQAFAFTSSLNGGSGKGSKSASNKKHTISEARTLMEDAELEHLISNDDIIKSAIQSVENDGIVFIDEIDKIASSSSARGADASADGVQRDLLPLIEGTTVSTKHGDIKTDHILFIASGSFHAVKPSDLLAELQGRLPIRVELQGLTEDDLFHILTETEHNLIKQQTQLMNVDGVKLVWQKDAVREVARVAAEVNRTVENIGARRLATIVERIVGEISYGAADMSDGTEIVIDVKAVNDKVQDLMKSADLQKYIL